MQFEPIKYEYGEGVFLSEHHRSFIVVGYTHIPGKVYLIVRDQFDTKKNPFPVDIEIVDKDQEGFNEALGSVIMALAEPLDDKENPDE